MEGEVAVEAVVRIMLRREGSEDRAMLMSITRRIMKMDHQLLRGVIEGIILTIDDGREVHHEMLRSRDLPVLSLPVRLQMMNGGIIAKWGVHLLQVMDMVTIGSVLLLLLWEVVWLPRRREHLDTVTDIRDHNLNIIILLLGMEGRSIADIGARNLLLPDRVGMVSRRTTLLERMMCHDGVVRPLMRIVEDILARVKLRKVRKMIVMQDDHLQLHRLFPLAMESG